MISQLIICSKKSYSRYGGWYTDTDTVTIKDNTRLRNTVALSGDFVANGNMFFQRGYQFLKKLITVANKMYTGKGELFSRRICISGFQIQAGIVLGQ